MQDRRVKKTIMTCLLVVAIMLPLTACGESDEVENLIDAIGTVTVTSGDAISTAQEAYDALDAEDQKKVENISVLVDAHDAYAIALKQQDYDEADAAYYAGKYLEAKEIFESLGDYKDSSDRAVEAEKANYYEEAMGLFKEGNYVDAQAMFELITDYSDAADMVTVCIYKQAVGLFDNGNYEDAQMLFTSLGNYEDAADRAVEAEKANYYEEAMGLFNEGNYEDAQAVFEQIADYSNAADMVTSCLYMQAESYMELGYLNTAKAVYETLPAEFSYDGGKSVADRLGSLEKYNAFVELCGVWNCGTMTGSVRQTHDSTGVYDEWEADSNNFTLTVTCVLNDDETVTVTAMANFWFFTNYSSLSANLKTTSSSCTFTYTGTDVPSKMYYSLDSEYQNSGTLTIKNKTFAFDYEIINATASMNFTYTYKTYGTYNTLVNSL